mmetsp:Transcript_5433/g.17170  ORF Transcript_5433/g.17170 Transcript_5433/m.17170 type:complete len:208 (-) Transcript_5433:283-906(-)
MLPTFLFAATATGFSLKISPINSCKSSPSSISSSSSFIACGIMLPNMFKLLFGGTPGLASRSALGDVKLLIGLSGFDFRLLSAMMYCVEFCGAFGTAVFFAAGAALPPLFAGVFFFFAGGAPPRGANTFVATVFFTCNGLFFFSLLFFFVVVVLLLLFFFLREKVAPPAPPPPGLNNSAVTLVFGSKKAATAGSSGCPLREVLAAGF